MREFEQKFVIYTTEKSGKLLGSLPPFKQNLNTI